MNLNGLCLVLFATSFAGVYSESNANATAIPEAGGTLQDSVTKDATVRDEASVVKGRNDFGIVGKFIEDLLAHEDAPSQDNKAEEGRTFGVKRLQFMLMPMMYKMGVMMTLLVVLTVISLKTLAIGVFLVVLKLSALFGKFYTYAHGSNQGWSSQPQPVHVHVHNSGGGNHHHSLHNGWDTASGYAEDEHYYYKG